MKQLLDAFIDLPSWQGACIIAAAFVLIFAVCVSIAFFAYVCGIRVGERAAVARHNQFVTKRRELASIQL